MTGTGKDRDSLLAWVRQQGGVARATSARRLGWSERTISGALAATALTRVRRVWLATRDADPYLLAAARAGVVVTCVTEARRRGLWVLDAADSHVAAPAHAGRVSVIAGTRVHRAEPLIARHPDVLVDPIENVLAAVASCQPFEAALAVWESAMRAGLVDRPTLERLPLRPAARAVLSEATPFSDSGLESFVVPRLSWTNLRIVPQVLLLGHRVDFLIGDRLVLQIDGGTHVGAQRTADIRHDAQLMLRGYHVIRVGYRQVVDDWPSVQDLILRAVAQGLHLAA